MKHVQEPSADTIGAGAPADTDIVITPEMIEAGVEALEDGLIEGYSIGIWRGDLVRNIYTIMRAAKSEPQHLEADPMKFVGEGTDRMDEAGKFGNGYGSGLSSVGRYPNDF